MKQGKVAALKVVRLKLSEVNPNPKNPRLHSPEQLRRLEKAIEDFGYSKGSMVVNSDGYLLAGHGIYEGLKAKGYAEADFVQVDLSEGKAEAFMIADNRLGEISTWDIPLLDSLMAELEDMDIELEDTGFELGEVEDMAEAWNVEGVDYPEIPMGDKQPFQQMAFILSDEQVEQVKAALDKAKKVAPFVDTGNENSNGNALARIAETYNGLS